MISVFFEPTRTKVLSGRITKNKTFFVDFHRVIQQGYLSALLSLDDFYLEEEIISFFKVLKRSIKNKSNEYNIILPDFCFEMAESFENNDPELLSKNIKDFIKIDDFYYSIPIESSPTMLTKFSSVYVIKKEVIKSIISIAEKVKVRIASIEPASMCFIRANGFKESIYTEIYEDSSTTVAFSAVQGITRYSEPTMNWAHLMQDENTANEDTAVFYALVDGILDKSFDGMFNDDVPHTIITDNAAVYDLSVLNSRMNTEISFPNFVDGILEEQPIEWLVSLGTLFQYLTPDYELFNGLPPYCHVSTANVLPKDFVKNIQMLSLKDKIVKMSHVAIFFLAITSFLELSLYLYFSSIEIPEELREEYNSVLVSNQELEKYINIINTANSEDAKHLYAYADVIREKNPEILFSNVKLNQIKNGSKWVELSVVSKDPILFQEYVSMLNSNERFSSVIITNIDSETDILKKATIQIEKGGN